MGPGLALRGAGFGVLSIAQTAVAEGVLKRRAVLGVIGGRVVLEPAVPGIRWRWDSFRTNSPDASRSPVTLSHAWFTRPFSEGLIVATPRSLRIQRSRLVGTVDHRTFPTPWGTSYEK